MLVRQAQLRSCAERRHFQNKFRVLVAPLFSHFYMDACALWLHSLKASILGAGDFEGQVPIPVHLKITTPQPIGYVERWTPERVDNPDSHPWVLWLGTNNDVYFLASEYSDVVRSPNIITSLRIMGYPVAHLVGALRYKPEGRGFDSRWCHWNFSLT
jgi:hypothetical protein